KKPTGGNPPEAWQMTDEEFDALPDEERSKHPPIEGGPRPSHSNYHGAAVLEALAAGKPVPQKVIDSLGGGYGPAVETAGKLGREAAAGRQPEAAPEPAAPEAPAAPPAAPAPEAPGTTAPPPESTPNPDGTRTGKDGTLYTRAPPGGAVSDL